jgi:hypothetical protein
MQDMVRNANLCGTPTDMYRLNDLEKLEMSQYKFIIFLNTFKLLPEQWQRIEMRIPKHVTILWNYAPGILNPDFSMSNIEKISGMKVRERTPILRPQIFPELGSFLAGTEPMRSRIDSNIDYPLLEILSSDLTQVLARYEDGAIAIASRKYEERNVIYSTLPFFEPEHLRQIAKIANCHLYAPCNCTVYADSRFIAVFPKYDIHNEKLEFKYEVSLASVVAERREFAVKSVELNLKAKEMEFFEMKRGHTPTFDT